MTQFLPPPPTDLFGVVRSQIFNFRFNKVFYAYRHMCNRYETYQIEFEFEGLGRVGRRPKFDLFSEYGHVAYQIIGTDACCNTLAHICLYAPPRLLWWGQKGKTNLKVVMLHIKLKEMERRAPHRHIFCPYTKPRPRGWGQKVKYLCGISN